MKKLHVIDGRRNVEEWRLLEMILSPDRYGVEECEALCGRLASRDRDGLRLAGGTQVSKALLGCVPDHLADGAGYPPPTGSFE